MHQSTTASLSETIWLRWVSIQLLTFHIVQTLLPVTFGYPLTSETEMKEAVTVVDTLTQEDFHGVLQKLLERHNKCIATGRDYFDGD